MPPDSQLLLAGDHLALVFPYDIVQVREVKKIPGARWDRLSKTWRAPLRSITEAREFAEKHGFFIEEELAGLVLPAAAHEAGVVKRKNELVITFPYDEVKIAAIRGVTDARWRPDDFAWVAPVTSMLEVVAWAEDFNVGISDEILEAVGRVEDSRTGLSALSNQTHLDEPLDTSGLNGTLLPFQHVGVAYALQTRRTFIADSMGLGKTVQAIAALHLGDALPAVVVCPPTLVLNWVNEIHTWLPTSKVVTLAGMAKKPLTDKVKRRKPASPAGGRLVRLDTKSDPQDIADHLADADFVVLGYSVIGAWRPVLTPRSLVCDESQYIKNKKAKRTKATVKLAKALPEDGMTLCLTGTPVLNRPAEFYPQLAALGHISDFGGEWAFYKRFCGMYTDRWGKVDISGATHKEELNDRLRSTCYVRRTKEEVLPDLTPIRHQIVPVQGDPVRMKEYRKAEDDIARYMAERAAAIAEELGLNPRSAAVMARIKAEAAEHIVRLSALRRLAALAKIPTIKEIVESHLEEGSKVVIAGHHRDVVSGLADEYGGVKIQGGMSVDEVELFKARFQESPDVPVIVLSIQAAKSGHTLTAAQDILMAELPWTPADADQVIARLHRIGQEGSVLATWLLCEGTIDYEIYDLLQAKRAVVDAVTDGREVEGGGDVVGGLLVSLVQRGFDLSV